MGAYKQFLASDIIITPFEVNKSFTFKGNALTGSDVGIDRFVGSNITGSLFNPLSDPTTGFITTQYQRLVYNSIEELYYSNYSNSTSSFGSPAATASLIPGSDPSGDVFVGPASSAGRYWNYPQTTLTFEHYFPVLQSDIIGVLSIPVRLFGNYIQPNSFIWTADSGSIYDDGQGNLIFSASGEICGNIFYPHGIAVLTGTTYTTGSLYGTGTYGSATYGDVNPVSVLNFVTSSNVTCSFSSSLTLFETQYKCTSRQNEFNFSLNPTILSGSTDDVPYSFATGSYFTPYVTTVGLYDEAQNLLAVGKLSQPLPLSPVTDTTILVNIDF
jgi:hypothetical protein